MNMITKPLTALTIGAAVALTPAVGFAQTPTPTTITMKSEIPTPQQQRKMVKMQSSTTKWVKSVKPAKRDKICKTLWGQKKTNVLKKKIKKNRRAYKLPQRFAFKATMQGVVMGCSR